MTQTGKAGARPKNRLWPALLAALCGVGLALSQPATSFWPLGLLGIGGLYALFQRGGGAGTGWIAGAVYFALTLRWVAEAFQVDAAAHGWMAPFAVAGLAGGLALFWAFGFWIARRFFKTGPLAFAACWAVAEFARGHVLTGFPWGLPGYLWLETPVAQTAELTGPYLMTFITFLVPALLVEAGMRRRFLPALAAVLLVGLGWIWGYVALTTPQHSGPVIRVAAVQPNIPQKEKWVQELRPQNLRTVLDLTQGAVAEGAELILWPESAVPYILDREPGILAMIGDILPDGAALVAGAQRIEIKGDDRVFYNSLLSIRDDGGIVDVYDKQHLVPFGEYLPLESLLTRLGIARLVQAPGTFGRGSGARVLTLPDGRQAAPVICYEAIFPEEIVTRGTRPAFLLHATNDGWFGASSGPWQHLAQARFRAIEQGLPVIRAANTGVSAIIDPRGRMLEHLPLLQGGVVKADLTLGAAPTLYASTGDLPFLGLMTLVLVISFGYWRRRPD